MIMITFLPVRLRVKEGLSCASSCMAVVSSATVWEMLGSVRAKDTVMVAVAMSSMTGAMHCMTWKPRSQAVISPRHRAQTHKVFTTSSAGSKLRVRTNSMVHFSLFCPLLTSRKFRSPATHRANMAAFRAILPRSLLNRNSRVGHTPKAPMAWHREWARYQVGSA